MTLQEASLGLVSTIIGGGFVAVPFSFYYLGIPLATITIVITAYLSYLSGELYIESRHKMPWRVDSMYEMGFILSGRKSIFIISFIIFFMCFGVSMIYFILVGNLSSRVVLSFFPDAKETFFAQRYFYECLLGVGLLPIIMKKELKEMKLASLILFYSVIVFTVLLFFSMVTQDWEGSNSYIGNAKYWIPEADYRVITSMSSIFVAFSYF